MNTTSQYFAPSLKITYVTTRSILCDSETYRPQNEGTTLHENEL